MPLYEYACVNCSHHFEERRKVTDPPASRCPECKSRVKRVYQPVGIIFKGSGFHVNDYGRTGEKRTGEKSKTDHGQTGEKSKTDHGQTGEKSKTDHGQTGEKSKTEATASAKSDN